MALRRRRILPLPRGEGNENVAHLNGLMSNYFLISGKLAAATACPTRLLFSSGK